MYSDIFIFYRLIEDGYITTKTSNPSANSSINSSINPSQFKNTITYPSIKNITTHSGMYPYKSSSTLIPSQTCHTSCSMSK